MILQSDLLHLLIRAYIGLFSTSKNVLSSSQRNVLPWTASKSNVNSNFDKIKRISAKARNLPMQLRGPVLKGSIACRWS
jgi:hypothetical protein